MKTFERYYFKQGGGKVSGVHLSLEMLRDAYFRDCDFHPNTWTLKFKRCVFDDCAIKNCLVNAVECEYKNDDGGLGA